MSKISFLAIICCIYVQYRAEAQQAIKADFNPEAWDVAASKHEFTEYKGKASLYLENGDAILKESQFKNGIIDYDISFEPGRKFLGVHFRIRDTLNYEDFYLRPHQSGNPDAMQYTPVFNGVSGWQLYHGEGHSTAYHYNFEEWTHVRLIVSDNKMDVFINDMSQPVLYVHDLKMEANTGEIGFGTFLGGAYYANLTYQAQENPQLMSKVEELPNPEPGTIQAWQVSGAFKESSISSIYDLKEFQSISKIKWESLHGEFNGTVNLAQVSPVSDETNTVLVKVVLTSGKNQVKRLDFGYSDIARIFVNNEIIYSGQRKFRSRDYRYLGTIGYFDAVYLDLKKGKNEIVIAVTETFGGWGLRAKLVDLEGIDVNSAN